MHGVSRWKGIEPLSGYGDAMHVSERRQAVRPFLVEYGLEHVG